MTILFMYLSGLFTLIYAVLLMIFTFFEWKLLVNDIVKGIILDTLYEKYNHTMINRARYDDFSSNRIFIRDPVFSAVS